MAQILVPTTDVDATGLTDAGAGSTNLYQSVDDGSTPNDADYYENTSPTGGSVGHKLSAGSDPGVDTGHVIHIRGVLTSGTANGSVDIFQGYPFDSDPAGGDNLVVSFIPTLTGSVDNYSYTLSEAEAAQITDYTDLYVKVACSGTGKGGAGSARVHNVYLEVPDAPSVNGNFFAMFRKLKDWWKELFGNKSPVFARQI